MARERARQRRWHRRLPGRLHRLGLGGLLAGTVLLAAPAFAGERASVTARAQATVVAPLSIVKVQDLSFGKIAASSTAATVTVDAGNGRCTVSGAILAVGTCQFAAFAGMGGKNMTAKVSLSATALLTGPGQSMLMDSITLGANPSISFSSTNGNGGNQRVSIVSNTGIFTMNIGGRLNVNANQAPGRYTGSFTITVQYQ